jgi:hypothetical protein
VHIRVIRGSIGLVWLRLGRAVLFAVNNALQSILDCTGALPKVRRLAVIPDNGLMPGNYTRMPRDHTRFGCLGILLLFAACFACFTWTTGLEHGSAIAFFGLLMLATIYVNDAVEWMKEKHRNRKAANANTGSPFDGA